MYLTNRNLALQVFRTHRRASLELKTRIASIDTSSPLNPILDVESPGQPVRETDFILFPFERLDSLITRLCYEQRSHDLSANLIHRAVEVMEETNPKVREDKRKSLQTSIHASFSRGLITGTKDVYLLFGIFNEGIFNRLVPKIHSDKSYNIVRLISQPMLRVAAFNRGIVLDPNEVMAVTGPSGFRSIMEMFNFDVSALSGRNFDRLLHSMSNQRRKTIQYDAVDLWLKLWDVLGNGKRIDSPLISGSKWTMLKVFEEIIRKQSKELLVKLLSIPGIRRDVFDLCLSRHSITGMLKHPWAFEVVDTWLIENGRDQARLGENSSVYAPVNPCPVPTNAVTGELVPSRLRDPSAIFLIDSDIKLKRVKDEIFKHSLVGISIINTSVVSLSTEEKSYLIDLSLVNSVFVAYLLKQILNRSSMKKVVFSLEAFLNQLQDIILKNESGIHFENLIDLRRDRIRKLDTRRLKQTETMEPVKSDLFHVGEDNQICYAPNPEINQHFIGYKRLSDLAVNILGVSHDRGLVFKEEAWLYRPMNEEVMRFASNDSFVLIEIEKKLESQGIVPSEILSYDPFSSQ
jgi:hypothetical protein